MTSCPTRAQSGALVGVALGFATLFGMSSANAAPRTVLQEMFTATWCVYCPPVGIVCGNIMDSYPTRFAFVQVHGSDIYATTWGNARNVFYNVTGYPTTWMDGTIQRVGQYGDSTYVNDFRNRPLTSDTVVRLGAAHLGGTTYRISAFVGLESSVTTNRAMKVEILQVLDHYPAGSSHYRNCFIQATTPQTITLTGGQSQTITRDVTFSATSWAQQSDIAIVALVQAPNASGPATVYNAANMDFPFHTLWTPGDMNCNGVVDNFDIDPFVMALSSPEGYATSFPLCNLLCADVNGDGLVNNFDINAFVDMLADL